MQRVKKDPRREFAVCETIKKDPRREFAARETMKKTPFSSLVARANPKNAPFRPLASPANPKEYPLQAFPHSQTTKKTSLPRPCTSESPEKSDGGVGFFGVLVFVVLNFFLPLPPPRERSACLYTAP